MPEYGIDLQKYAKPLAVMPEQRMPAEIETNDEAPLHPLDRALAALGNNDDAIDTIAFKMALKGIDARQVSTDY